MKKLGRPNEGRKKVCMTIMPTTHKIIKSRIKRKDKTQDTAGKIVDKLFGGGE